MDATQVIINASDLKSILDKENLVLLDARTGKDAHLNYLKSHLKNARFVDLEKDLAAVPKDASNGGRHPLPNLLDFAKTLSDLGIKTNSHVVVYDDKNGANAAARTWWMLKAFGIEHVQVLNGGLQQAEQEALEMESGEKPFAKSTLKIPENWLLPLSNIDEVEQEIAENTATVIDVRDAERYHGISEPIDLVAGHIPGAVNMPLTENLDENGLFLTPEKLKEKYQVLLKGKPEKIIFQCGSGVTACHGILALTHAGYKIPNLYVGSWSEWSRSGKLRNEM